MKNKSNKNRNFTAALFGALGAILSVAMVVLMVSGDLQKVVHFRGVDEEIVFTFFVIMMGGISLTSAISCMVNRE